MTTANWRPDVLGDGYRQRVIDLGEDPDGEGAITAVLVRKEAGPTAGPEAGPTGGPAAGSGSSVDGVALYVHGFSDYFFQTELADFLTERGLAFYGLDLRKCGRSRQPGHTAHYVSDLALYDQELDEALAVIEAEHPGRPVYVIAHSTGGLILPLWLDRRRAAGRVGPIAGLVLNSPWFDLQGKAVNRGPVTQALRVLARIRPFQALKLPPGVYTETLHTSGTGEWEFDLAWKPMHGFPVTFGWLNAIRRGQARLHRGLDVGVPNLVLRSDRTHFSSRYSEASDRADTVLDVAQIARWAGCLGNRTTVVPVPGARHDVFLSQPDVRSAAYEALERWLSEQAPLGSTAAGSRTRTRR